MLFREISRFLGRFLLYFTLILCIPLVVAAAYEFFLDPLSHPQEHSTLAFAKTIVICLALASIFLYFGKKATGNFHRRESAIIVTLVWGIAAAISALPFIFTKTIENPIDAYFEAVSGLTTTGSTVLYPKAYDPATGEEIAISLPSRTDERIIYTFHGNVAPIRDKTTGAITHTGVEAVGKALLFWRSFLCWLGGMGIVVLFITILPALSMGGRFLFEAEVPGPTKEALTPRIKETASILWKLYLGLTAAQVVLLMITNPAITFFDALTLSFSTISTGGFSIHNDGISFYHNINTEWVTILFMVAGSINFTLYFYCLRGKIYRIYEPEFFVFLATLIGGSLFMTWLLWDTPKLLFPQSGELFSFWEALRYGTFQAVSCQSSTGFAVTNYDLWPMATHSLMLIMMFLGGMSGSTTGGMKIARLCILFRVVIHKIESIFRPNAVRCLKIGKKEISDKTAITVLVFVCLFISLAVIGTFFLVLDGVDPQTSMGIISCMINNNGVSFGSAAMNDSCAFLPIFSKCISILWMLLGRLELFVVLVLFVPAFWKER